MVGRVERVGRCIVDRGAIAELLVGCSDRVREKPSSKRSLDPLTSSGHQCRVIRKHLKHKIREKT